MVDFAPISFVASVPYALMVDPKLPVKLVQEFIAYAKAGNINSEIARFTQIARAAGIKAE